MSSRNLSWFILVDCTKIYEPQTIGPAILADTNTAMDAIAGRYFMIFGQDKLGKIFF